LLPSFTPVIDACTHFPLRFTCVCARTHTRTECVKEADAATRQHGCLCVRVEEGGDLHDLTLTSEGKFIVDTHVATSAFHPLALLRSLRHVIPIYKQLILAVLVRTHPRASSVEFQGQGGGRGRAGRGGGGRGRGAGGGGGGTRRAGTRELR